MAQHPARFVGLCPAAIPRPTSVQSVRNVAQPIRECRGLLGRQRAEALHERWDRIVRQAGEVSDIKLGARSRSGCACRPGIGPIPVGHCCVGAQQHGYAKVAIEARLGESDGHQEHDDSEPRGKNGGAEAQHGESEDGSVGLQPDHGYDALTIRFGSTVWCDVATKTNHAIPMTATQMASAMRSPTALNLSYDAKNRSPDTSKSSTAPLNGRASRSARP